MRKNIFLLAISLLFLIVSCDNDDDKTGTVTFGANYHFINCITNVTVYVDGEKLGALQNPADEITECNSPENISKKLPIGDHTYLIEIRPESGTGCTKNISGYFTLVDNKCEIVFIDYREIEF